MPLQLSGDVLLATDPTGPVLVLTNQSIVSYSCWMRQDQLQGWSDGNKVMAWGCSDNNGYYNNYLSLLSNGIDARAYAQETVAATTYNNDAEVQVGGSLPNGQVSHVALVLNKGVATLFVNGLQEWTQNIVNWSGSVLPMEGAPFGVDSLNALLLGCYDGGVVNNVTQPGLKVTLQDAAVWVGYALTANDCLALRNQSSTPAQIGSTGSLAWWVSLDGTAGQTAAVKDAALADKSNNNRFPITSITLANGAKAPVYTTGPLVYTAPAKVLSAVIAPSQRGIVLTFSDLAGHTTNLQSLKSNPTLTINGSPVTLSNPVWGITQTNGPNLPYVYYSLPSGTVVKSGDDWRLNATDPWALTVAGSVQSLVNYQIPTNSIPTSLLPPFVNGPKTMPVGYVLGYFDLNWLVQPIHTNLAKQIVNWDGSNIVLDANGYPTAGTGLSAVITQPTNGNNTGTAAPGSYYNVHGTPPPNPATWTLMWDGPGYAPGSTTTPALTLGNSGQDGCTVTQLTSPAPVLQANGPNNSVSYQINQDPTVNNNLNLSPYIQVLASVPGFTNLRVYPPDPANPSVSLNGSQEFHPNYLQMLSGASHLRFDAMIDNVGGMMCVDFADFMPYSYCGYGMNTRYAGTWAGANLTQIEPYHDPTNYFHGEGAVILTFDRPPGFKTGNRLDSINLSGTAQNGIFPLYDSNQVHISDINLNSGQWAGLVLVPGSDPISGIDRGLTANQVAYSNTALHDSHPPSGVSCTINQIYTAPSPNTWSAHSAIQPGLPLQSAINLCNTVGAHLWFNIPYGLTDAAVSSVFDLFGQSLKPGLKIYAEYSNECWNVGAAQYYGANYCIGMGNAGSGATGNPAGFAYDDYTRYYAYRAGQVHSLAKTALAKYGRGGDLVHVMGVQGANADGTTGLITSYCSQHNIPIDAVAGAPYFSNYPAAAEGLSGGWEPSLISVFDAMNPDQLMDMGELNILYGKWADVYIKSHYKYVGTGTSFPNAYVITYEGGPQSGLPNTAQGNPTAADRSHTWARHPRMRAIMLQALQSFQDAGCKLFTDQQLSDANDDAGGSNWTVYYAYGMKPGLGDGSDNLYDNRKSWANYPAITWDYKNLVSVVGSAINYWNSLTTGGGAMQIGGAVTGGVANEVLFVDASGNLGQNSGLTFTNVSGPILTIGNGNPSTQILFNYGPGNGGDFTGEMGGVGQLSFGFNNNAQYGGGTAQTNSGRVLYFYDRITSTYLGGIAGNDGTFNWGPGAGAMKIRPDGSIGLATLTDAAAVDNSLYFSSTTNKLSYKDSTGTVHAI